VQSGPLGPLCTAAVLVATALLLALPFLRTVTGAGREEARL
jgi:DHA1 family chloramphenicol resistance protein-like MFS transporter